MKCLSLLVGCIIFNLFIAAKAVAVPRSNIWYLGASALSLKSDYVPARDLQSRHDIIFNSSAVAIGSYGEFEIDFDDSATGYRVYLGIRANEGFDFEFGFISMGKVAGKFSSAALTGGSTVITSTSLRSEANIDGYATHFQWSPTVFEDAEVMVRLGLFKWKGIINSEFDTTDPTFRTRTSREDNEGYDEYYGVGFRYRLDEKFSLRADLDRYTMAEAEADVLSVAIEFEY